MVYTFAEMDNFCHAEIAYKGTSMFIQDLGDKRNSVRVNFVADVTVRVNQENSTINGRLQNLSIDGILLRSDEKVAAGEPCSVAIVVKDRNSRLMIDEVAGEVVRCEDGEMGIKFRQPFEWLALFHIYHSKSAAN